MVEIGCLLGELAQKFNRYSIDSSVVEAVDREIGALQEVVAQKGMDIRYDALEHFRSKYKAELGACFFEKHRFILPSIYEYLDDHTSATAASSQFINDPASLKENRLSRYFAFQN